MASLFDYYKVDPGHDMPSSVEAVMEAWEQRGKKGKAQSWDKNIGHYAGRQGFVKSMEAPTKLNMPLSKLPETHNPKDAVGYYMVGGVPGSLLPDIWLDEMNKLGTKNRFHRPVTLKDWDDEYGADLRMKGINPELVNDPIMGRDLGRHPRLSEIVRMFYPAWYQEQLKAMKGGGKR